MKILVKRDRDDLGWIVSKDGQLSFGDPVVYADLTIAILEALEEYDRDQVFVDDRFHHKMGNGLVVTMGDQQLVQVEREKKGA